MAANSNRKGLTKKEQAKDTGKAHIPMSAGRAIIISGIAGAFLAFIPLVGLIISGGLAAYWHKSRSLLKSVGVGIASGFVSFLIGIVIATFIPFIISGLIGAPHNLVCPSVQAASIPAPALCQVIDTVRSILFISYLSFWIFAPIGGLIGGLLIRRNNQSSVIK